MVRASLATVPCPLHRRAVSDVCIVEVSLHVLRDLHESEERHTKPVPVDEEADAHRGDLVPHRPGDCVRVCLEVEGLVDVSLDWGSPR